MSTQRGLLTREELLDLISIRNDVAKRYRFVDPQLLNVEITTLALHAGLRGDELRTAAERFAKSVQGIRK